MRGWTMAAGLSIGTLIGALIGCGPEPVAVPEWKPDAAASQCMQQYDKDGDGALSKKEWEASPALKAASYLDADGNGEISADEIKERIQLYKERALVKQFICYVKANGPQAPLPDAKVELIPEPFLTEFLKPVSATTGPDGMAVVDGAQVGLYRVSITHPQLKVDKKFNTETTLGCEISPVTVPNQAGPPVFIVRVGR